MTDEMMTLRSLVEKASDSDLREMIGFAAERLMELEVGGLTGAAYGEKSAERLSSVTAIATGSGRRVLARAMVDLKARGLAVAPEMAVGDGVLGFWKALDEVFPGTRHQRCWVHKTSNVLGKFPKSMAPTVKSDLRDIWQAETRAAADAAIDTFAEKYGTKYDKAVAGLVKDRGTLLAFFDFPAETGTTCERPTRSRACSPRSDTGPSGPRARSRRGRQS